ncbi:DUF1120 domain-containing protein [Serratia fonticola]|uniref:DUF1120 domain-containing protein n=1 Tax=Serratia fonticola TaxID=47917 RepID=UPI0016467CD1|nr:DUF1120 domain-containing protein [Serratia fonticola]MBC3252461.1 DUF1120 domain-containing protein [Serratia fonticola]
MLKLNQVQKTVCALAVLAATSLPALAASSVDVRVIGTITPTACMPTLAGGGTIDYGVIHPNTLSDDAYTVLAEKQTTFSIVCDAPAKVAVQIVNQRVGSLAGSSNETSNGGTAPNGVTIFGTTASIGAAGLGLDGTSKIGGYGMRMVPGSFTIDDNTAVDGIYRNSAASDWILHAAGSTGSIFNVNTPRQISWAETGKTLPVAFTTLSGQLGVQAYINKASELDLTKPVSLDGLTTIELVYL